MRHLTHKYFSSFEQLAPFKNGLNDLLAESRHGSPFLHVSWIKAWWGAYRKGHWQAKLLAIFDGGDIVGFAPFYIAVEKKAGLRYRQLRMMGDRNVGTSQIDVLVRPEYREAVVEVIANEIACLDFEFVRLSPITNDTFLQDLKKRFRRSYQTKHAEISFLRLPRQKQQFMTSLSRNKRKEVRRRVRKLQDATNLRFHHESITQPSQLQDLFELNSSRFESVGIDGGFRDQRLRQFYQEFCRDFNSVGIVHKFSLLADNRPIAVLAIIEYEDRWYAFQGGFDPVWASYSPGNVLDMFVFEFAIDRGISFYDFGPGEQEYKARFGAKKYQTIEIDMAKNSTWDFIYRSHRLLRRFSHRYPIPRLKTTKQPGAYSHSKVGR